MQKLLTGQYTRGTAMKVGSCRSVLASSELMTLASVARALVVIQAMIPSGVIAAERITRSG